MEMMDMGWKPKETERPQVTSSEAPKMQYPRMYIERNVPPDLMDKDVGHICRLEILAKVVSKSIDERDENKNERLELEIHKMGYLGKSGKATKEEYIAMDDEKKEDYHKKMMEEEREEKENA